MLCSKCHKNEASIYYKQNINGKVTEYALCAECAAKGEDSFSPLNIFSFPLHEIKMEVKRCDLCGCSFDDIRHSGKVGCGKCYSVFSDELEPMIKGIHNNTVHVVRDVKEESVSEIEGLRIELNNAVKAEEYEKAAELRDKIKELEGKNDENK